MVEKSREYYANNRRAFFQDCLHVRDRSGSGLTKLRLTPAQASLMNLIEKIENFNLERTRELNSIDKTVRVTKLPVEVVILKPRKEGMSTLVEALAYHYCEFNPHINVLVMAHLREGASNIADIAKRFSDFYPKDMEYDKVPTKTNNTGVEWGIWNEEPWESNIAIATANTENVGRGKDYNFLHISEVAHFRNPNAISVAKSALVTSKEYYCFEESTANGMDASFYKSFREGMRFEEVYNYWKSHKMTPPGWNGKYRFFWAWWQDPEYKISISKEQEKWIMNNLSPREEELVKEWKVTPAQLEWRRNTIKTKCSEQSSMDPLDFFDQEFPDIPDRAFVNSGSSVFQHSALAILERASTHVKPDWHGYLTNTEGKVFAQKSKVENHDTSSCVIYREPQQGHEYIISADAAEGLVHGDYSVAMVFDRLDGNMLEEVAIYRGKCSGKELGDYIYYLANRYNMAYVIPEAMHSGVATAQRLVELRYPHIYHHVNESAVGEQRRTSSFTPGFRMFQSNKFMVIEEASDFVRKKKLQLRSKHVIREMLGFTNNNGKLSAPPGENDDCVICVALACHAQVRAAPPIKVENKLVERTQNVEFKDYFWEAIKKKKARANKAHEKKKKLKAKGLYIPKVPNLFE